MTSGFKKQIERLKTSLLDRESYSKTVKTATYITLIFVGGLMTILNVVTEGIGWGNGVQSLLTYTTLAFVILSSFCFLFSLINSITSKISAFIFGVGIVGMFTIFLISGQPDGFSAIWICLTPIATMVFYGRKTGTIYSLIMFVILALILWVRLYQYIPVIDEIQYKEYGSTFMIRFPILYLSFFAVVFLLETIQDYQFDVLEKVNGTNEKYSTHDQLTGLLNRKGFYDTLEVELEKRTYNKIGFIIFDLDLFKRLNDTYGHLAGDEVLIEFANLIGECLPKSLSCRWGGEEFLICYFDDDINKADLEKFRKIVQDHVFVSENQVLRTTVSGGVFETNDRNYSNRTTWLKNADTALYKSKETGRNKITYF